MRQRRFIQCDVFTLVPTKGNGLAVVVDGDGLSDQQMQVFAAWTNLAETTFLLPPSTPEAITTCVFSRLLAKCCSPDTRRLRRLGTPEMAAGVLFLASARV